MGSPPPKLFFIHIMKTGGTTFYFNLRAHFGPEHVFPGDGDGEMVDRYLEVRRLTELTEDRLRTIRAFAGHYPFVASQMVGLPVRTITVLREPVDRTISYLFQRMSSGSHAGASPEEVYEDGYLNPFWIANHQTKVFALSTDDTFEDVRQPLEIDRHRLERAKANLEQVEVIGLQSHYVDFTREVEQRFGIPASVRKQRVNTSAKEIPASLRRRIEEDLRYDLELYDFAESLQRERGRERDSPTSVSS